MKFFTLAENNEVSMQAKNIQGKKKEKNISSFKFYIIGQMCAIHAIGDIMFALHFNNCSFVAIL